MPYFNMGEYLSTLIFIRYPSIPDNKNITTFFLQKIHQDKITSPKADLIQIHFYIALVLPPR